MLAINNIYRERKTKSLVVFLGEQENNKFGFFREANNPDTFFGLKLIDVELVDNEDEKMDK